MNNKESTAEQEFNNKFEEAYSGKSPDYNTHVNIAVVGKVSSGKSSLLNAFFERDRNDPLATVGATSGVTTKVTPHRLDENVIIYDCPGLNDIREENTQETQEFLDSIDFGIFVVTDSADASQKAGFDDLKSSSKSVCVVLNQIDKWDDLEESAYEEVLKQWREALGVEKIFGTCAKGYDPKMRKDTPMDIRGVNELRDEVMRFLKENKKDILVAKHMKNKDKYAAGIIATALIAVAVEAFIPGSAAYITATQVVAIGSLYYLYTGNVLDKSTALGILPTFIAQSVGRNLFLWAKSALPPTGVIDAAAAAVAVTVTFATLGAVMFVLREDKSLDDSAALKDAFDKFKKIGEKLKDISIEDFKDYKKINNLVLKLLN